MRNAISAIGEKRRRRVLIPILAAVLAAGSVAGVSLASGGGSASSADTDSVIVPLPPGQSSAAAGSSYVEIELPSRVRVPPPADEPALIKLEADFVDLPLSARQSGGVGGSSTDIGAAVR